MKPPPFTSLWKGPQLHDQVENVPPQWETGEMAGTPISITLSSTGLFGLDADGAAWTLCNRLYTGFYCWVRVDELLSGVAARRLLAGPHPLTPDGHCYWHGPNCSEVNVVGK